MSLTGFQINTIDVNFHLQKSLEIFDKNSAVKIWSKRQRGEKCPPSCQLGLKVLKCTVFNQNNNFWLATKGSWIQNYFLWWRLITTINFIVIKVENSTTQMTSYSTVAGLDNETISRLSLSYSRRSWQVDVTFNSNSGPMRY